MNVTDQPQAGLPLPQEETGRKRSGVVGVAYEGASMGHDLMHTSAAVSGTRDE